MGNQHSALRVKLSDIVEGLEFQADERFSFLNLTTGEVVSVTTEELRAAEENEPLEDFPEWQHDAMRIARDVVATEHYLPLPDRFESNEYHIMERFCLSVDDDDLRDDLCDAIRGLCLWTRPLVRWYTRSSGRTGGYRLDNGGLALCPHSDACSPVDAYRCAHPDGSGKSYIRHVFL